MPTITDLISTAYTEAADNLVLAGELPLVQKQLSIANPKTVAVARGMAVISADGDLCVAGTASKTGNVTAIVAEDMDLDADSDSLVVTCYVFGAFNAAAVSGLGDVDLTTQAIALGAQGNGIYLV